MGGGGGRMHQNANGGYLWGRGLCTMVIFYFMLLCISSCLQRTWIACKIRKKTINVIKNESKENQLTIDTSIYL